MAHAPGDFKSPVSNHFTTRAEGDLRPERESNPRVRVLQTLALPLGDQATGGILAGPLLLGKPGLMEYLLHHSRILRPPI